MNILPTNDHALAQIIARETFRNHGRTLSAEWTTYPSRGSAPQEVRDALLTATRNNTEAVYVVYSYATPIAWARRDDNLLTVPAMRYSATTSQHQNMCLGGRPSVPNDWNEAYVTTGRNVQMGDPGQVRKGKGGSPFGTGGMAARMYG